MSDDRRDTKEKKKSKPKGNRLLIILIVAALAATAAIALGTYVAVNVSEREDELELSGEQTTVKGVSDLHDEEAAEVSGFPYKSEDGAVLEMNMLGDKLLVLSDGGLTLLASDGVPLYCVPHSYSSPGIELAGSRAILYDKASDKYRVFDKKGEVFNSSVESGNIVTCAVSESGRYAAVTSSSGSASILTVFSKDSKKTLFEWKCSSDRIVDVAISPRGNNIAAAALSAQNGQIISKVYLLNLDMTQSPQPYICERGAVIEVKYISEKLVSVITNSGRILVNQDGEEQGYLSAFDSNLLRGICSDSSGNTAVLLDSLQGVGASEVQVYDKSNTEKYDGVIQQGVTRAFCHRGRVYLLSARSVSLYGDEGEKLGEEELQAPCTLLSANGDTVYCSNGADIYKVIF